MTLGSCVLGVRVRNHEVCPSHYACCSFRHRQSLRYNWWSKKDLLWLEYFTCGDLARRPTTPSGEPRFPMLPTGCSYQGSCSPSGTTSSVAWDLVFLALCWHLLPAGTLEHRSVVSKTARASVCCVLHLELLVARSRYRPKITVRCRCQV